MKNIKPLVSICIPCYNHERYIEDCINSILVQDYEKIELIIVDDCSTDNSVLHITNMKSKIETKVERFVFLVNETNCGNCKTMNKAFKHVRGKYIFPMASDDAIFPSCISIMVNAIENTSYLICTGDSVIVEDNWHFNQKKYITNEHLLEIPSYINDDNIFIEVLKHNFLPSPGTIFCNNLLDEIGNYDEELKFADWDFRLRILRTHKIKFISETVYYYRRSNTSSSSFERTNDKKTAEWRFLYQYEGARDTLLKHIKYVDKKKGEKILSDWFIDQICISFSVKNNLKNVRVIIKRDIQKYKVKFTINQIIRCFKACIKEEIKRKYRIIYKRNKDAGEI